MVCCCVIGPIKTCVLPAADAASHAIGWSGVGSAGVVGAIATTGAGVTIVVGGSGKGCSGVVGLLATGGVDTGVGVVGLVGLAAAAPAAAWIALLCICTVA
jgi:hypothetical protein